MQNLLKDIQDPTLDLQQVSNMKSSSCLQLLMVKGIIPKCAQTTDIYKVD